MIQQELNHLSRDELIKLIQKERRYNRLLTDAIRHYAMQLLTELKELKSNGLTENDIRTDAATTDED